MSSRQADIAAIEAKIAEFNLAGRIEAIKAQYAAEDQVVRARCQELLKQAGIYDQFAGLEMERATLARGCNEFIRQVSGQNNELLAALRVMRSLDGGKPALKALPGGAEVAKGPDGSASPEPAADAAQGDASTPPPPTDPEPIAPLPV